MKLTWNEDKTVVMDENGNTATVGYWGTCEKAEKSLATLSNCRNCTNCSGCSECSYCQSSSRCSYCSDCQGSTRCSHCLDCSGCSDCSWCSDCSDCSDCSECHGCSRCSDCSRCSVSGKLGDYNYWVCGDTAAVGCETHKIDKWLAFSRNDIVPMASDAGDWYDSYWNVWTELLKAGRGKGVYNAVE